METAEQTKSRVKQNLENQLIQLKANLITQPLNENIKKHIKEHEECLKKYYPDSKLLKKTTVNENSNKNKKTTADSLVKKKKKTISSTIKKLVWNTHVGEEIGKTKCLCCKSTDITQLSFNCGHIIAEANGGNTIVSNLKPICQNCNSSMGTKNMDEFMLSLK
jgi:5-methylcytosine-specific restriction endonuclease McrA